MVLQSGIIPYEYAIGGGRFQSSPLPIGISGILLEQAQFVIVAELRKWNSSQHLLPDFFVYTNINIAPSGPYEPKSIGTTLDNLINPGAAIFVDNIAECRSALNLLFSNYATDSDLTTFDYRKGWLQSIYPESPSGFISGYDEQAFSTATGHWRHRLPSEVGVIDYVSDEILGASGVLFDIDFAEVMFNPSPHIAGFGLDTAHGTTAGGAADTFSIQQSPLFPAFQKTNGNIISLTGREPSFLRNSLYNTLHMSSGCIRLHGYALFPDTQFLLSREFIFDGTEDFIHFSEGIRRPIANNVASTVAFLTPTSQSSGVYRIAAVNRRNDFPNTSVESGIFSQWPQPGIYWPSDHPTNSTTTLANAGYHVFDDCIWMTDRSPSATFGGPNFGYPSGLSMLSPFTGHRLWVRYADMTPVDVNLFGSNTSYNWSTAIGLERESMNNIYRLMPDIQRPTLTTSGQFVFAQYNDTLDYGSTIVTTSASPNGDNYVPLGGNAGGVNDFWFDGTHYFITAAQFVGFDMWKFDSSFNYVTKYVFNLPSGIHNARGASINGQNVLFYGQLNNTANNFATSGIFPINFATDGTEPFDGTANTPEVGEANISFATAKYINGESLLGVAHFAEIMDLFEVTAASHVEAGIYAIVRFQLNTSPFNSGNFYLLRLEESATSWEIRALTRLETSVANSVVRREITYIPY